MAKKFVNDLIYPDLSYKILGILFEIHNKLGTKYQEKHYQKAIEAKLKLLGIPYKKEKKIVLSLYGEKIGDFYVDFIIDNKIILELKKIWQISFDDIKQVLRYLDTAKLKLGIIANFKYKKLQYRRILNSRISTN